MKLYPIRLIAAFLWNRLYIPLMLICAVTLTLRCRAGVEINLNPSLLLDSLTENTGFTADQVKTERFAVLNGALEDFR